jgi:mycobactin peptide synthetase MbtF
VTDSSEPEVEVEDVLALSPLQQGFFSLAKLAGDGVDLYTMQFVADIDGPLDTARLRRSAEAMLARHPNLRASFWDRELPHPVQIIPTSVTLPWRELSAESIEFDVIAETERLTNFDLTRGPLLRFVLLHTPRDTGAAGKRFRFILTVHHILMDAWALSVFFRELIVVYQCGGDASELPAARPYRDYIGWLAGQDIRAATQSWVDYLAPLTGPTMLAENGAAPVGTVVPQRIEMSLDRAATARLTGWASEQRLTMNTVLQWAWAVVLSRLTDRCDVAFGTVVSGRPPELTGVESMVGLFLNSIPVVVQLSPQAEVARQCQALQQRGAAMRDVGYVGLSQLQRAAGRGSLFDTLLVFENVPFGSVTDNTVVSDDGVRFRPVAAESLAHYPLTLVSYPPEDELVLMLEAVPEALAHLSVPDIGERMLSVLRQLPASHGVVAGRLDVLLPKERDRLAGAARGTCDDRPGGQPRTVTAAFNQQAGATPDAAALTSADGTLSYTQLSAAVTRLARRLAARGVGPEDRVALALPRSPASVIAILAVLQAGAAYVPIDVELPLDRIDSILRQCQPVLTLTVRHSAATVNGHPCAGEVVALDDPAVARDIAGRDTAPMPDRAHREGAAYVIFTSGSTGEPKGVVGTHRALLSYFADHRERVYRPARAALGRPLKIAHAWSFSFDASWQPLVGLLDGHAVHLFSAQEMRDATRLVEGIERWRIDMIDTSPSMFAQLNAAGLLDLRASECSDRPRLTALALGGETTAADDRDHLRALSATAVHNCYGPTEATVEAVVADAADCPIVNIGAPVRGMRGHVLDSALRPVPDGVAGELYLSGAQLARGYLGRPAETAARFVADPYRAGERMYRTGDLVRRLTTGELTYLGRGDDQVKVRGYRIEVAEVVAALSGSSGVATAAVVPARTPTGTQLLGFVTGDGDGAPAPDVATVRRDIGRRLPAYMVPARIMAVAAMPLTPHGKLDTEALLALASEAAGDGGPPSRKPATDTEQALSDALAGLFGGAAPDPQQDLFEFGMDSIVAISLVNKARQLGLTPRMVLTNPTIELLAAAVDKGHDEPRGGVPDDSERFGTVVPPPIVSWMYEYGGFRRFTQSVWLTLPPNLVAGQLEAVLQAVLDRHDMLRARLDVVDGGYRLTTRPPGVVRAADILTRVYGLPDDAVAAHVRAVIDGIDPAAGVMVRALWCDVPSPDSGRLLFVVHHLATDVVSWYVLVAGMAAAWEQLANRENPALPGEYTTYRQWSQLLEQRSHSAEVAAQRDYWLAQLAGPDPALGSRMPDPRRDTLASLRTTEAVTEMGDTRVMLDKIASAGAGVTVQDFLLTSLVMALISWRRLLGRGKAPAQPDESVLLHLESHGRGDVSPGSRGAADTSATVGWFTQIYPIRLGAGRAVDVDTVRRNPSAARDLLQAVTDSVAAVPNNGLDYGLLRYRRRDPDLLAAPAPQVVFNYMGRLDLTRGRLDIGQPSPSGRDQTYEPRTADEPWSLVTDNALSLPTVPEPDLPLHYVFDVNALVQGTAAGPQLVTYWRWSDRLTSEEQAAELAALWRNAVTTLAAAL